MGKIAILAAGQTAWCLALNKTPEKKTNTNIPLSLLIILGK